MYREADDIISALKTKLKAKEENIKHNELKLKAIDDLLTKNNTSLKVSKENKRELEKEVRKAESVIEDIEEKENDMLKSDEGKKKKELKDEYFSIKSNIQDKTAQIQLDILAETRILERLNMMIMMKASKREHLHRRITEIEYKLKNTAENQKFENEEMDKLNSELQELKIKCEQDIKKKEDLTLNIEREEKEGFILKGEIFQFEEERQIRKEERRIKEALEQLSKDEKGYYGFFYELVNPIQSKYQIAIKVALQTVLKLIVVDTTETALRVDEYLNEKGLYMDCLILEKVPQDTSFNKIHTKRRKLEGRGHMILDVVDCDKNIPGLENALKYFCGDKVVCLENLDGYDNTITLSNKGFKRVITLDGTSLSSGMFESGYHSNIFDKDLGKPKHDKEIKLKKK